jgi:selenide, water dikinase
MAHGGGCGCKLSPAVLATLLGDIREAQPFKQLLVGTETGDDAAVWQIDEHTCLISTTDFFMPMVDNPRDFGRIAATNAISDIYAMGGRPIFALAILGMPLGKIAPERVREILQGGREVCQAAGIPVAGGHSIDTPEPIYGLAVNGICAPSELRRNCDAKAKDVLILTKPVGVGIYSAAFKKEALSPADYADMVGSMTTLNRIGADLAKQPLVHAMTDVTGFGVLGHAAGLRHRRLGAELGELWRRGRSSTGLSAVATPAPHRPSDLGRTSRRLRTRRGGPDPRDDPRGGLFFGKRHRGDARGRPRHRGVVARGVGRGRELAKGWRMHRCWERSGRVH